MALGVSFKRGSMRLSDGAIFTLADLTQSGRKAASGPVHNQSLSKAS